jgi:hypothetical protein
MSPCTTANPNPNTSLERQRATLACWRDEPRDRFQWSLQLGSRRLHGRLTRCQLPIARDQTMCLSACPQRGPTPLYARLRSDYQSFGAHLTSMQPLFPLELLRGVFLTMLSLCERLFCQINPISLGGNPTHKTWPRR